MVGALERLEHASGRRDPRDSSALATLKLASPRDFFGLLATHPPLQKRIQALQAAQLAGSSTAGLFGSSRV
jgi:Zn-dependent protease with chaperone function